MNPYVTYEHPDTGYAIEAMSLDEFQAGGQDRVACSDCYIWQYAESKEQAISQHESKHAQWALDMESGLPEKDIY